VKLPLFDLNDWFATAEGRFDLSLSHSACETQAVSELVNDDELKSFLDTPLGYGPFEGLPELRSVIADQYNSVDAAQVITFNGPSEAIYTFMQAMLRPGGGSVANVSYAPFDCAADWMPGERMAANRGTVL